MNRRARTRVVAIVMASVLVLTLVGGLLSVTNSPTPDVASDDTSVPSVPVTRASDLPTIAFTQLPVEAQDTLRLVVEGGPYPYERDGVVFENREGLLPAEAAGYYHEYTVPTPGESGRGARRLVIGGDRIVAYFTDDHYESFREVVNG